MKMSTLKKMCFPTKLKRSLKIIPTFNPNEELARLDGQDRFLRMFCLAKYFLAGFSHTARSNFWTVS